MLALCFSAYTALTCHLISMCIADGIISTAKAIAAVEQIVLAGMLPQEGRLDNSAFPGLIISEQWRHGAGNLQGPLPLSDAWHKRHQLPFMCRAHISSPQSSLKVGGSAAEAYAHAEVLRVADDEMWALALQVIRTLALCLYVSLRRDLNAKSAASNVLSVLVHCLGLHGKAAQQLYA